MGRTGGVRGGERDEEQAAVGGAGRLGESLGEGELGIEGATGQVRGVVELAGVGDPLVDEDEARAEFVEELAKGVACISGRTVIGGDTGVSLGSAELVGEFAPEGVYDRAVGLV